MQFYYSNETCCEYLSTSHYCIIVTVNYFTDYRLVGHDLTVLNETDQNADLAYTKRQVSTCEHRKIGKY